MTRTQLNLVLLIAATGLGAAVFFSQKKEEKGAPLTTLTAEIINKIALEHPGAAAIELEKRNGKWKLTAPVQADADPFEVNGILALATLETKSALEPAQVKLADLGLDPPQYSISLNGQKLEFGGVEPLQYRRYIKTGSKIALVEDPPSAALDQDYSDLVVKKLLPENSEIMQIALPGLTLSKSADGKGWTLSPDDPGTSADQKQKLVDSWKNARAMWNAAEPAEGSRGDEVTITLQDREIKFIVAQREPQLVLARPDLKVRFTLSKALVDELLKLPEEKKEEKKEGKSAESAAPSPN